MRSQRFVRPPRLIAVTRYRHRHQPANPVFTHCVLHPQPVRVRPLVHELQPFFAITAFSISLSRLRSTTSFFSRAFSSRNCLAPYASLTSIRPYLALKIAEPLRCVPRGSTAKLGFQAGSSRRTEIAILPHLESSNSSQTQCSLITAHLDRVG
jgi:hypothetical protein